MLSTTDGSLFVLITLRIAKQTGAVKIAKGSVTTVTVQGSQQLFLSLTKQITNTK